MKITIETTRENQRLIYFAVKEKYPQINIQLYIQKSFTAVDIIQISLSTAQLVTGVIALIPTVLPKKEKPKIKITIKDEIQGRQLILEGDDINATKIIKEFIENLN